MKTMELGVCSTFFSSKSTVELLELGVFDEKIWSEANFFIWSCVELSQTRTKYPIFNLI
jgi:hypothetical protein